jgi:hypothetical protein
MLELFKDSISEERLKYGLTYKEALKLREVKIERLKREREEIERERHEESQRMKSSQIRNSIMEK